MTAVMEAVTPAGLRRMEAELRELQQWRCEISAQVREAREFGNPEENAEYHEAKREQGFVESRIAELKDVLARSVVLDPCDIPTDQVGIGSVALVRERSSGDEWEVTLVTSVEADPDADLISCECPMGAALLGRRVAEVAEVMAPAGMAQYEILSIRRPA